MKHLLITLLMLASFQVMGQRMDEYTASNGITYKPGDTIELNQGSGANGDFVYLTIGGWAAGSSNQMLGANFAGLAVDLKKIRTVKFKGAEKVLFTVGGGNITNYFLYIEQAIESCEVKPCKDTEATATGESKLDKLKKLKDLLDMEAITQAEYDQMKKEILE